MKKSVLVGLFLAILIISFVSAQENVTSEDKAYTCLRDQINNKSSLSLQEAVFSTLALGSTDKADATINDEKGANCWPKSGCDVKDTAQVLLAYDRINTNSKDIENWLLGRNATVTELNWYIEIDSTNQPNASCTIKYDTTTANIRIGEDMKLSGSGGSCLSVSSNGYWLAVTKSSNCMEKTYEITCDQDFVTTTLYQKTGGTTIFVSSETHSAASLGSTQEKVGAKCFRSGSNCDYEGSLWAAIALKEKGYDITPYLPYILALSDDNARYFPSAFGYMLTGRDDQYGKVAESQKQGKYWELAASPYNRYYDSSLGMLALAGMGSAERDNAKSYFLSIQTSQGCWNNNNIRDTAFILYSGWQKSVSQNSGSGSGTVAEVFCSEVGKYCEQPFDCTNAGGIVSGETCPGIGSVCCSVEIKEETCAQQNGVVCRFDEKCSFAPVPSADGDCCLGICEPIPSAITECESAQGICKVSCGDNEDLSFESCGLNSGLSCCKARQQSGGIGFWGWLLIIILIIMIILVVLAIIYRDKLRIWWMKRKNKAEVNPVTRPGMPMGRPPFGRPAVPPFGTRPLTGQGMIPGNRPQPMRRPPITPQVRPQAKSVKDKELEETLKKLKEMGK